MFFSWKIIGNNKTNKLLTTFMVWFISGFCPTTYRELHQSFTNLNDNWFLVVVVVVDGMVVGYLYFVNIGI